MRKLYSIVCLVIFQLYFISSRLQAQCDNIGFETGTTTGWKLTYGTVTDQNQKTIFVNEVTGTRDSEHYITKLSDGNDPKIRDEAIPMVAPGSNHSIRIGNTTTGTRFTRISTQYQVTADNSLFQYQFAVILQNTAGNGGISHASYQKPGFNILIFDELGNELPCSSYDIQLEGTNTVNGFKSQGDLQYRNWTKGAVDLRNSIGKLLTIVVTVHGCTQRGHFGYAYFDAECFRSEIGMVSGCPDENGMAALKAPAGFAKYEWSNGATGEINKVPGRPGDQYEVKLLPYSSLDESCMVRLAYKLEYRAMEVRLTENVCEGMGVAVGDTTYFESGSYMRKVRSTSLCDSTVYLDLKVNKTVYREQAARICAGQGLKVGDSLLTEPGTYVVTIKRGALCDSIVTTHVSVDDFRYVSADSSFVIVQGEGILLDGSVTPAGTYRVAWTPSEGLSCRDCPVAEARPEKSTVYKLVTSTDDNRCPLERKYRILVHMCDVTLPGAFTPDRDGANETFYIMARPCVRTIRKFIVYDRWGEVIYMKEDFPAGSPADGWDGSYRGTPVSPGAFAFKVIAERDDGYLIVHTGNFVLIR